MSTEFKLTKEQNEIIHSSYENIIVNGVPGSAKTTTLVIRQAKKLKQTNTKYRIIFLTKVSNITEELVNRLSKYCPGITYKYHSGSRVTAEYNGHSLGFQIMMPLLIVNYVLQQ